MLQRGRGNRSVVEMYRQESTEKLKGGGARPKMNLESAYKNVTTRMITVTFVDPMNVMILIQ